MWREVFLRLHRRRHRLRRLRPRPRSLTPAHTAAKVIISSRKADVCERVAKELSAEGRCEAIPADLSHDEGAQGLAAAVRERTDRLDVLVNITDSGLITLEENNTECCYARQDKVWVRCPATSRGSSTPSTPAAAPATTTRAPTGKSPASKPKPRQPAVRRFGGAPPCQVPWYRGPAVRADHALRRLHLLAWFSATCSNLHGSRRW
ncbi:hypothetical protein GCM10023176_56900 [Micromonospora coerulea]|uniref:Short subunit dehydrogenase n=1 Tax=Micromonospora coerulea TaxID=47856 RepID=A0ABP8T474_9ACTN